MRFPEVPAQALTRIRVAGVPEHFNLPWHLGLERRAFVRAGIEVKWRTVPEGTGAMCQLLRTCEVDVAMLVTEGAVRDILHGNPSRIIAAYVDTPLTWGVHVGVGQSITGPEGLQGVGYAISKPNSGSHLAALAYTRNLGRAVQEQELEVVNDLNGALARLAKPRPVAFLWEKYTTQPQVDAGKLRRVDEHRSAWPAFMLVATETILAEHPKEVERLLKVIRDQASGLMSKKTAPDMVAHRYSMSLPDAQAWFDTVRWNVGAPVEPAMLQAVAGELAAAGAASSPTTGQDLANRLLWRPMAS
mgnify:CR=1 FL=1